MQSVGRITLALLSFPEYMEKLLTCSLTFQANLCLPFCLCPSPPPSLRGSQDDITPACTRSTSTWRRRCDVDKRLFADALYQVSGDELNCTQTILIERFHLNQGGPNNETSVLIGEMSSVLVYKNTIVWEHQYDRYLTIYNWKFSRDQMFALFAKV